VIVGTDKPADPIPVKSNIAQNREKTTEHLGQRKRGPRQKIPWGKRRIYPRSA